MKKKKVENPNKTKYEEWKGLQIEWLKERDLKRGKNPINKDFFNWLFKEYQKTRSYEKEFLQVYHYMVRSTVYSHKYAHTSQKQREEFISQCYLYLYDYVIDRWDSTKGSAFNYLLSIIKGAIVFVINRDEQERNKDLKAQQEIVGRMFRDSSIRDVTSKGKPTLPTMLRELSINHSRVNEGELNLNLYELEKELYKQNVKNLILKHLPDDYIDVAFISDEKLVKFRNDIVFRRSPFYVQLAVYILPKSKLETLDMFDNENTLLDKNGRFTPYNKRTSEISKKNALVHYNKLCVFEYYNPLYFNEQQKQLKKYINDKALFTRVEGFQYIMTKANYDGNYNDTLLESQIKELLTLYPNNFSKMDEYDLSSDFIPKSVFDFENKLSEYTDKFESKYDIEIDYDILELKGDSFNILSKNILDNKIWVDIVLSGKYDNVSRFYNAGLIKKVNQQ